MPKDRNTCGSARPPHPHPAAPMNGFASANLIHLFDFYLAAMFVIGTYRRFAQYRATAGLALSMPGRWPRLFQLVRQHQTVFMTWQTFLPSALALAIWVTNMLAS